MKDFTSYTLPYSTDPAFDRKVAYFCMEFGIDQALKIYSGGLGYLAGSHMRSAYELKQNLIGIGILWKKGYYDQGWSDDHKFEARFRIKHYDFLEDTGIEFQIDVNQHPVWVKAFYLAPEVFGTAPIFLLSTDHPENDHLARTISHRLYDNNKEAKVAQYVLLGKGGATLLDLLNWEPSIYHLNEAHALPAAFHLYQKLGSVEKVRERMVFTTHTPVEAGNEKHDIHLLNRMSFFGDVPLKKVREITGIDDSVFNQSLVSLRLSHQANGVSKKHGEVAREMWEAYEGICPIGHITNSQNHKYWHDPQLDAALEANDTTAFKSRKRELKTQLFEIVADQTGALFDPDVLTLVWARRFARYKRADLITRDLAAFEAMIHHADFPIQIIWAGKPYPMDYGAIDVFNRLIDLSLRYENCVVVVGYELRLSKALKQGSDIWLNCPYITREASGTSGMTAAMNGSVNLSVPDGWIPEFIDHGKNGFMVPAADPNDPKEIQDVQDRLNLMRVLTQEIQPMYYQQPERWWTLVMQAQRQIRPFFDSDRMATAYYEELYKTVVSV